MVANNRNKIIKKGEEIKVTYGRRSNRYLLTYYGFGLNYNLSDSLNFRMLLDFGVARDFNIPFGVFY